MTVIDAHVHIYPPKIALRAVQSVAAFYSITSGEGYKGTGTSYLEKISGSPIKHAIVCSVAVKPATVQSINDFIASECAAHGEFTGFMAMHQDFADPQAEIERAMDLGLKGIKIHPDTQQVNADDPRLMDVYAIAEEKHLPVMIHAGDYRFEYSHPERIKRILQAFPDLVVNAAHFGGWSLFDIAADVLVSERCFVDTSSSIMFVGKRHARELINFYGSERVMFGTDFPMWNPIAEAQALGELGLSEQEYERVSHLNAEAFLGVRPFL